MITSLIPNFKGKRWLKILLRSFHTLGVAGVFSSLFIEGEQLLYWALLIVSGVGLLMLEALSNFLWFVQVRALFLYIKLTLLALFYFYPDYAWHCLVTMILLSGVISHAPSSVRYFSFVHGKKVQSIKDIKG
jgi:hypothetical protein